MMEIYEVGMHCLADPVAMWHVRSEIAPAVLLVVDFGGWYMEDSKAVEGHSKQTDMIPHRQVSLLKDVIVPYTHLLPVLHPSKEHRRKTLLYFKGARHRHRTGLVRDKLWSVLEHEQGVVLEEGFPNITGQEQALRGMRDAEFCLHPAGDTPTSCRLFDAVASLCIPVIVSDNIELPFEGMLDYTDFCLFVAVHNAIQPKFLVQYLAGISINQRETMRARLAEVQHMFEYDNGFSGGIGPVAERGSVNLIWNKIGSKVPIIKEAITRERRKPLDTFTPTRCQCL